MKKPLNLMILAVAFLMGLSLVSAVTCTESGSSLTAISKTINEGQTISSQNLVCSNTLNQTITATRLGAFFQLSSSSGNAPFNIDALGSKTITLDYSSLTQGSYQGYISFSDGSSIPINVVVNKVSQTDILVFPTSKVLTVKQGDEKTQNILISVASSYPRVITIQSLDFNPGTETIKFGDLNLGQIAPGQSISIPIIFTGKEAQVGTYQTNLKIFATDSSGQIDLPTINLQLQVTQGVTPVTNNTFSVKPNCALSASTMNLNTTQKLTCSNVDFNIRVNPLYNEFFEGLGSETIGGIYTYNFKPVKYGNTNFKARFTSLDGSPLFSEFSQEVVISSSGATLPGSELGFIFTPSLSKAKSGDFVVIQLVDTKTNSTVANPEVLIDAIPLVQNNSIFKFNFLAQKTYNIRGKSPGYTDLVKDISLSSIPMTMNITPETGDSLTTFTITTSAENASLLIDGVKVSNPYIGFLTAGNHELLGSKEGYIDITRNITIEQGLSVSGDFIQNTLNILSLTKNASYEIIYYSKDINENETIVKGYGNKIQITPEKAGTYLLITDGKTLNSYAISKKKSNIWWWVGGIVLLIGGIWYLYNRNQETPSSDTDFSI